MTEMLMAPAAMTEGVQRPSVVDIVSKTRLRRGGGDAGGGGGVCDGGGGVNDGGGVRGDHPSTDESHGCAMSRPRRRGRCTTGQRRPAL